MIPAVLSAVFFRPLRGGCSIKERGRRCAADGQTEALVLPNFFTAGNGE
jgi:hypothetical protein